VAGSVKNRSTGIIMLDLFSIRNEQEFYQALATEAIKATAEKIIGWIELRKQFLKHITPRISGADPAQDFDISFEWKELEKNCREVLNLPKKIAEAKNIQLIVCSDEFQLKRSSLMNNPVTFRILIRYTSCGSGKTSCAGKQKLADMGTWLDLYKLFTFSSINCFTIFSSS
jgi:hypothetical protein